MPEINAFVEAVGKDVSATVVPRIEALAQRVSEQVRAEYGPRISAFADQLLKDAIDQQSATVRDFVIALIQELALRYRPELQGELHTKIVQGGIELTGQAIRLDLLRRDSSTPVTSLDIPVSIRIKLDELAVNLQNTTIKLDVLR